MYKLLDKKNLNKALLGLITALIVSGCNTTVTTPVIATDTKPNQTLSAASTEKYPDFELLIEQKKTNGEIISIGSKGVQSVSIDGFDYPVNKLVKDQLQIEIPKVVPGKHQLNVSLYLVKDEFTVPLIIPNLSQKIYVLLRLTIDESNREIKKIEYGYDLDRNGITDSDMDRFESIGTKNFYAINSSGIRQKIDAYINANKALPSEAVPPPGVVPTSAPQSNQKNDTSQPQIQIPEPPKPKTNDAELYPLPPTGKVDPVPVPIDIDKGDNKIPTDQQPATPLPQLPDLDQQ